MMVNCPKCQLLQPKDQYCAGCGINMETWKPPETPIWKRLLGNWMVQLAILLILVFAVVLRDSFRDRRDRGDEALNRGPRVPVASPERTSSELESSQAESEPSPAAAPAAAAPERVAQARALLDETAQSDGAWQQRATLRALLMTRTMIERLNQKGQRLGGTAFLLKREDFEKMLTQNRREIQVIGSSSQSFQWEAPLSLFVGEEDLETGLNLGFMVQSRLSRAANGPGVRADLRQWSQLQLNGEQGAQSLLDVTLSRDNLLVLVDLNAQDMEFTAEERSLFETSPKLRVLNEASFVEGLTEIALVLTLD